MRFIRKAGAPAEKSPKRLLVEPAELARKLVKEMDDHTISRGEDVWARNRYVVYLCPEDYENLVPRAGQLTNELTGKLIKHARDMGYILQEDLTVEMVLDPELELGYFGILAQRGAPSQGAAAPVPPPVAPVAASAAAAGPVAATGPAAEPAAASAYAPPPGPAYAPPPPAPPAASAAVAGMAAGVAASGRPAEQRVIVITSGDDVREFNQGRVIVGRSKEADLRIEDANVSRKHAAIYWADGRLMIEDLGSTNGTLVNGYPVTTTVLKARDVVAIGESRLTVESK